MRLPVYGLQSKKKSKEREEQGHKEATLIYSING